MKLSEWERDLIARALSTMSDTANGLANSQTDLKKRANLRQVAVDCHRLSGVMAKAVAVEIPGEPIEATA